MNENISFELETIAQLKNYNNWIAGSFYPFIRGSLIEIGAGIGTFSELFNDRVDSLTLLEPSSKFCEKLEEKFSGEKHVEIIKSPLESLEKHFENRYFDCAVMVNVLEHIREDKDALRILFELLKPGGHVLIFVPALMPLFSDLDDALGHYRRYHLLELEEKVKMMGFKIIKSNYFDWLGSIPWWLINVMLKQKTISTKAAIFYDRLGIPVTRYIEQFIKPPFGKNLILVAKKIS